MQRFLFLSFSPPPSALFFSLCLFFSPLFSLSPLSLFRLLSLHQDAIIQDISEEELKALTVEEGPRVLSESCDANTHTHARTHTHFDYRSTI